MDWNTYNLKGTRDAVKEKLSQDAKLPQPAKDFLSAEIDALPAECTHVVVNAYGQAHAQGHGTMRNIQVTVAGVSF